ncbi:MAG: hypothetical protein GX613_00850 [Chloroflexi bacterium]|nr:hypothetical protein [Chloroflexota bacterium]
MGDILTRSTAADHAWPRRIGAALLGLALGVMIAYFAIYVAYAAGLMRFPFDYDQGEGFELVDTIMLSEGQWPYRDAEVYPFYASNYPPLYHVMLIPFAWLFGPAYWYGRLVGFLGTLVTAGALGYAVWRSERHRTIAALAGLAFLASNTVYHVGPLFRQHMTMVMFETLAIVVLASAPERPFPTRRRLIIGLALLLAAGYTKQLALATCVAAFVWLFLRSPRRALAWGVLFAAVAGGLFAWIHLATDGQWTLHIIAANVNEFMAQQAIDLYRQWFRLHAPLILLAALLALYEVYFTRLSIYSVWWVLAVANSALSGKWGAGDSYFATAIAATCLLSGIAAARTLRGGWAIPDDHPFAARLAGLRAWMAGRRAGLLSAAAIVIPLLYLWYGASVLHLPTEGPVFEQVANTLGVESSYGDRYAFYDSAGWVPGYATIGHIPTQADIDAGKRISAIVAAGDLPALSEEAGFSLYAEKEVITNPTQLKNLYENGQYDPAALIDAIEAHAFNVVVFRAQFYPPPVLAAIYDAYTPSETITMNGFAYEIWRPNTDGAEGTGAD